MISSNKQTTGHTHPCNQTILDHKRNTKKSKRRAMPGFTSVLCITSALLCSSGIPTVQGFGFDSLNQSKLRIFRQPSDLKYRSHPDVLSVEQHAQHMKATSNLVRHLAKQQSKPEHHVSNFIHTWWTASKTRRAELALARQEARQEKEQIVLDDYLESIDRRYKRMHSHDNKSKKNDPDTVSNVAWNFLTQTESSSAVEEQRKQEDAIYVLGLAELASKKLLQKHHLPIPESKQQYQQGATVIDVQDNTVIENSNSKVMSKAVPFQPKVRPATLVTSAVFCIEIVKNMQKAYMNRLSLISNTAKDAMQLGGKAISATIASAASLITNNGGGVSKYAVHFVSIFAMTLMSKSTALSALRPLTKA